MAANSEAQTQEALLPVEEKFEQARQEVEDEIAKIEPQYMRLLELRRRFSGDNDSTTTSRSDGSSTRRQGGRQGQREDEMLRIITERPGITISQLAEVMGLENANYLYRVRDKLKDKNKIRVEGSNLVAV